LDSDGLGCPLLDSDGLGWTRMDSDGLGCRFQVPYTMGGLIPLVHSVYSNARTMKVGQEPGRARPWREGLLGGKDSSVAGRWRQG
jgi:hypothetical protein